MQCLVVIYTDAYMASLVCLVAVEPSDRLERAIRKDVHFVAA